MLGRFLSSDPLMNPGDPRTLDPYRYADNNPVMFTDASGLMPIVLKPPVLGRKLKLEGSTGGGGGALPTDVCYQSSSPCWVGGAEAKTYQVAQALRGNDIDPWANVTCYDWRDGYCDAGGMYESHLPATANDWLALIAITVAFTAGYLCGPVALECAAAVAEIYASGGGGNVIRAGLSTADAGTAAAVEEGLAANSESSLLSIATEDSWGSVSTLDRHFIDHGAEFGAASADEYASQASAFFQRGLQDGLPTKIDSYGVIRVYDANTNTFGAFNPDGTARTFFKPSSSTYWDR